MPDKNTIWLMRDGTKLTVSQMSDGHLINSALRCVRLSWRLEWLPILEKEIDNRGLEDQYSYGLGMIHAAKITAIEKEDEFQIVGAL